MLEMHLHSDNTFVTLTYNPENLPEDQSVNPRHSSLFLKKLRKAIYPAKLRYYCVGEYGDETERPHYHLALFGYPNCSYGRTRHSARRSTCCPSCDLILRTWGLGSILLGTLETASAQYLAGYVTKKMTQKGDSRLNGRHPEFARMSNRPGLGADAMPEVASALMMQNHDEDMADAPSALRHGKKLWPLGRYLQQQLRMHLGKEKQAPQAVIDKISAEMLPLRIAARNDSQNPSFTRHLVKSQNQAALNQATRAKIFKQGKTL